MAYGITDNGFVRKTQEEIIADLENEWKIAFGQDSDLSLDSPNSIIIGLISQMADELWQTAENVYNCNNPVQASGVCLSNASNLVNVVRKDASASTANVSFKGNNQTIIPADTQVKQSIGNIVFKTTAQSSITSDACNWIQLQINLLANSVSYVLYINGDTYSYNSDSSATFDEIVLGLKAAIEGANIGLTITNQESGLFTIEATDKNDIYDISITSKFNIVKVQSVIEVECLNTGNNQVNALTIDTISTAIFGLDSVINYYDGNVGTNQETDQELRIRRKTDISTIGFNFTDAIKAKVAAINGVSYCRVYENDNLITDANGIPAKSFETIVVGGSNQEIADLLYLSKTAGIKSFGTENVLVRDSDNIPHYIKFTRPANFYFWVRITITQYDAETDFPVDGSDAIKQAILNYGNSLNIGENVIVQKFYNPLYSVDGIAATTIEIAATNLPTDIPVYGTANINCNIRQIPNFDLTRIIVNL